MKRRLALLLAPLAFGACVVWPAGSGPNAAPLTFEQAQALGEKAVFVDVREPWQFAESHIPGAINVPAEQVDARAEELRRLGRLPVFYCG